MRTNAPTVSSVSPYWKTSAWLTLPPLILSFALWSRLPAAFSADAFSLDVPEGIRLPENILRVLVFAVPLLFPVRTRETGNLWGWALYGVGLGAYAASYIALIAWPHSSWSMSLVGFAAPAWTTLPWLLGIGWLSGPAFAPTWLRSKHYLVIAMMFVAFHVTHTVLVFQRLC